MLSASEGFVFESGKTYTHSIGLSCCFRQWRAQSHCKYLHGYSLQVTLTFRSLELDERNWVVDFGSLKSFKGWLEDMFDHKTLVAEDDPEYNTIIALAEKGICQPVALPNVGMEAMAYYIYQYLETWLIDNGYSASRVVLESVEVKEHESNWARYRKIGD